MFLQLQPGERAETRGMLVAELNGQKGTIVCYMESTGRYLLELEDTGKTLSLRKANLKTETKTETESDSGASKVEKVEVVETMDDEDDGLQDPIEQMPRITGDIPKANPNMSTTSSTTEEKIEAEMEKAKGMKISELKMKLMAKGIPTMTFVEKHEMIRAYAEAVVNEEEEYNRIYHINDFVTYRRFDGTTAQARVIEDLYFNDRPHYVVRILSSGLEITTTGPRLTLISSSQNQRPAVREPNVLESLFLKMYDAVSWPTLIVGLLAIIWMWPDGSSSTHNETYWHLSHYNFRYWNWWGIVVALGPLVVLGVYTHKIGTNNGSRKFNWNRAWNALLQMDFWELIQLASLFEIAVCFLGLLLGRRRR